MFNFNELSIGDKFHLNGMNCTKKSTRTAWIDGDNKALWFYFGLRETVRYGWC